MPVSSGSKANRRRAATVDTTPDRLLDAAERLFGEHGIHGASLRSVMAAADANPASVHYHFGTKEALIEAAVLRRMHLIVDAQAARLDAAGAEPAVRDVVEVLVHSLRDVVRDDDGQRYIRFVARLFADRSTPLVAAVLHHFGPHMTRLAHALAAALPELPPHVLAVRTSITFDVVLQELARWDEVVQPWVAQPDRIDLDEFAEHLIDYATGGLARGGTSRAAAGGIRPRRRKGLQRRV